MKEKDYKEYCKILNETHIPANVSKEAALKSYDPLIRWVFNNTPKELFKFRACNNNNIDAFRNQQIWFATGSKMNDDFDSFFYVDIKKILKDLNSYFTSDGLLIPLKHIKENSIIPDKISKLFDLNLIEKIKEHIKLMKEDSLKTISVSIKKYIEDEFKKSFPYVKESIQNTIKFTSFSEDIYSPLMWGHYAANSTGFALAYDFRKGNFSECQHCDHRYKACFSSKLNTLLPIVYDNNLLDATEYGKHIMQDALIKKLLFEIKCPQQVYSTVLSTMPDIFMQQKIICHKFKKWEYEQEWRMTISDEFPNYHINKLDFIKKKPEALYLGRRIKDTDELILRHIAYQQNIPVYKMTITSSSKRYRLKPICIKNTKKDLFLNKHFL